MRSTLKWLYAKSNLALALIFHFAFKKWFQKKGLKQFLENYKSEEINFPSHPHCIFCGMEIIKPHEH